MSAQLLVTRRWLENGNCRMLASMEKPFGSRVKRRFSS
jgi:hypothetical protein